MGHVGVADAAVSGHQVLFLNRQVVLRRDHAVLESTQGRAVFVHRQLGGIQSAETFLRAFFGGEVEAVESQFTDRHVHVGRGEGDLVVFRVIAVHADLEVEGRARDEELSARVGFRIRLGRRERADVHRAGTLVRCIERNRDARATGSRSRALESVRRRRAELERDRDADVARRSRMSARSVQGLPAS